MVIRKKRRREKARESIGIGNIRTGNEERNTLWGRAVRHIVSNVSESSPFFPGGFTYLFYLYRTYLRFFFG